MSISNDSDSKLINNPYNQIIKTPSQKENNLLTNKRKFQFQRYSNYNKRRKIIEITIIILAIISYILYYLSLGGCDGTQTECLKNSNIAYYYMLVSFCFISAGIISLIIYFIILKLVSKWHLVHIIVVFLILFFYDTGSTLINHGTYNIIGFIIFLILYTILLFVVVLVQSILEKANLPIKLIVINSIILLIIFSRYIVHNKFKAECVDWDLGLNNTRIKDDKNIYPCQINRPISCHLNFFNNKQDLSNLLKLNCSNNINSNQAINARNQLVKYINRSELEKTKRFGFPLTNTLKFKINETLTPDVFTKNVYDNILDMDNLPNDLKPEEYPEVTLNFDEIGDYKEGDKSMKYMGKININITKNEAISQERKTKESAFSFFNNIIMIYTDAVSRAHFKRKMPKTCQFIEQFMKNNFENDFNDFNDLIIQRKSNNINNARNLENKNILKINTTMQKKDQLNKHNLNINNNKLNINIKANKSLKSNNLSKIINSNITKERFDTKLKNKIYQNKNRTKYLNQLKKNLTKLNKFGVYKKLNSSKINKMKIQRLNRGKINKQNILNKIKKNITNINIHNITNNISKNIINSIINNITNIIINNITNNITNIIINNITNNITNITINNITNNLENTITNNIIYDLSINKTNNLENNLTNNITNNLENNISNYMTDNLINNMTNNLENNLINIMTNHLENNLINNITNSIENNITNSTENITNDNNINENNIINSKNISDITNFEDKYYAYQFLKYHTFTSGTKFNAMPMFFGESVYKIKAYNIIKYFKRLGYVTAQSIDMCSKEVWEPEKEPPNIDFDFWDHENVAMFCDPSYMDRKSLYSIYKGVYSLLRRCFYGKEVHDYIFEYGTKFWETYPDNRKFLRIGFNDGHESTFEVLKYLDDPLYEFLNTFYQKGYLKNTALILVSDHGNHMPGIYNLFLSEQYETERVLGNLFLIINSDILFNEKKETFKIFNENVMENQQSIITPYDIYDTLVHIIYGDLNNNLFTNRGTSFFMKINNLYRNCKFFDEDNEEKGLCKCVPNAKYDKFVYYNKNN